MKTNFKKLIGALGLALLANSSMATTTSADVNVTGEVVGGCSFASASYNVNFGQIPFGTVAKASFDPQYICSTGTLYNITLDRAPSLIAILGTPENLSFSVATDSGFTSEITDVVGFGGTGNGTLQSQTLYVKAVNNAGIAPVTADGKGLLVPATISTNFSLILTY